MAAASTCALLVLLWHALVQAAAGELFEVAGTLKWTEAADPARISLVLTTNGSELRHAWPRADGSFVFSHVPAGAHLLDVVCPDLTYPQLRVDVSARLHGRAVASYADNPTRRLSQPLLIRPLGPAEYFEKRAPFSPIAFVKTPYGLMIVFAVFALFVLPKLKVDPEEYQEMQQQLMGSSAGGAAAARSPAAAIAAPGGSGRDGAVQRRRER